MHVLVTFVFLGFWMSHFPPLVSVVLLKCVLEMSVPKLKIYRLHLGVDRHAPTMREYEQLISLFLSCVFVYCMMGDCINTTSYELFII